MGASPFDISQHREREAEGWSNRDSAKGWRAEAMQRLKEMGGGGGGGGGEIVGWSKRPGARQKMKKEEKPR